MSLTPAQSFSCVGLVLVLMSCQAPPPPKNPAPITSSTPSAGAERSVIVAAPVAEVKRKETLKVLGLGHAPFSPLRHLLTPGQTARHTYELQTYVGIVIAGQRFPLRPMPKARLIVQTRLRSTRAAESAHAEFLVKEAESIGVDAFDPPVAQVAEEQMREITGLMVDLTVSVTGHVSKVVVTSPHGIRPATQQLVDVIAEAFQDSIATFPQEPVGPGARWQVTRAITMGGIAMWRRTTYTLESRDVSRITLAAKHQYRGKPQPMPLIDAPKGSSARLESLSGHGTLAQQYNVKTATIMSASETMLELDYTYRDKDADRALGMRMRSRIDVKPDVASLRKKGAKDARPPARGHPGPKPPREPTQP